MLNKNKAGVEYIAFAGIKSRNRQYLCRCPNCGCEFVMFASGFYAGHNKCSCRHLKKNNERLYGIWENMKTRCYNSNVPVYKYYGARGISVCDEWKCSFKSFYEWAIKNGYSQELSIDRIDVDGNYSPNNCRWVDKIQQANNKRTTILVDGVSLKRYCRENGLNYKTMHGRKTRHPDVSIEELVNCDRSSLRMYKEGI